MELDQDGDGLLSFEEFRKAPWLRDQDEDTQEDRFEALDADGDLKLSPVELGAGKNPERRRPEGRGRPKRPDEGGRGTRNGGEAARAGEAI
jgi:hypothetical protein